MTMEAGTRTVVASTYVSLDGVIQLDGDWHFKYFDADAGAFATEVAFAADAMVMGRDTYDLFAAAWPNVKDEFGDHMNNMPKYVATSRPGALEWNNSTAIEGSVADTVRRLKSEPGKNIILYGHGPVARELMDNGLIDEHHIWVHPVIVGEGTRLFVDGFKPAAFELTGTRTTASGVAILSYQSAQG